MNLSEMNSLEPDPTKQNIHPNPNLVKIGNLSKLIIRAVSAFMDDESATSESEDDDCISINVANERDLILENCLKQNVPLLKKFISDSSTKTLFVEKLTYSSDSGSSGSDEEKDPKDEDSQFSKKVPKKNSSSKKKLTEQKSRNPDQDRGDRGDASATKDDDFEDELDKDLFQRYEISTQAKTKNDKSVITTQSLAFVKKSETGYLEKEKPLTVQIETVYLSNQQELFSSLHNIVSKAISPYFRSYLKSSAQNNNNNNNYSADNEHFESDKMAQSVEKKIAELEAGLLHLQQNIGIPEVTLQFHQTISEACEIARKNNNEATVQVLGDIVKDPLI